MVIANPIYDVVFKKLMQNTRIARFFIETILEEPVIEVEVKPEGFVYNKNKEQTETEIETEKQQVLTSMAIVLFDFVATIKTATGEHKKVLIEIQKSRHPMDIVRFRNYLGLNYQVKDEIHLESGKKILALPIVSIYILGFKLPEIPTPVVSVSRQYIDQINHKVIPQKSEFIERLTHDCHVVQIPRIEGKLQTKLEQLLTVFEQKYFIDDRGIVKEYKYEIEDEHIKEIMEMLNYAVLDPETKRLIDVEQEAYRVYNLPNTDWLEVQEKLEKAEGKLIEKDKTIEEKNKAIETLAKELAELKRQKEK